MPVGARWCAKDVTERPTAARPAGKVEERGESKGLEDEERILLTVCG